MTLGELKSKSAINKNGGESPSRKSKKSSGRRSPSKPSDSSGQPQQQHGKKKARVRDRAGGQRHNNNTNNKSNKSNNRKHNHHPPHSKSGGGPTSKVPHDMPMGKKDLYFALDCEMVGVGQHGLDSALARVSIVNYDREVVLDTFVRVPVPVTDYRTYVSGIRSEDICSKDAKTLEETRDAVQNILRGKILIGHGLENDLKALQMTHPWCDTRDTAHYEPYMRKVKGSDNKADSKNKSSVMLCPRRLKDLSLEILGLEIQVPGQPHSPVEDSLAALELYKAVRPEWENRMCAQVQHANGLEMAQHTEAAAAQQHPPAVFFKSLRQFTTSKRVQPAPSNVSSPSHKQNPYLPPPHLMQQPGNYVFASDGLPMFYVPPQHYHAHPKASHTFVQRSRPHMARYPLPAVRQ